jgi:GxxExxY protein
MTKQQIQELTYKVIGAAVSVQKEIGPGLLESVYEKCFCHELILRGIKFEKQKIITVNYKGLELDAELRLDVLIENMIVVELKAVDTLMPIHEAQLLTYMKLLEKPKGLLINFNTANVSKEGIKSMVNELYRELEE